MLLGWWDSQLPEQIKLYKVSHQICHFNPISRCLLITGTENTVISLPSFEIFFFGKKNIAAVFTPSIMRHARAALPRVNKQDEQSDSLGPSSLQETLHNSVSFPQATDFPSAFFFPAGCWNMLFEVK